LNLDTSDSSSSACRRSSTATCDASAAPCTVSRVTIEIWSTVRAISSEAADCCEAAVAIDCTIPARLSADAVIRPSACPAPLASATPLLTRSAPCSNCFTAVPV